MQHPELATWLQEHKESLIASLGEGEQGRGAFVTALIDQMAETARTGQCEALDALAGQAARQTIMEEKPLGRLLREPRRLKEAMWSQLKQEGRPASEVLSLLEAAEPIFSRVIQVITRSYFEASQQVLDAMAAEIARMHRETERRVLDRTADLTRANVELSRLQQAKTDFISIAAHELKTPLTLIQGYTNMLREIDLETNGANERVRHMLNGILRGTDRLSAIVEDMLDVSVIDTNALSLRIERVSLASAVNLVVSKNARHLEERNLTVHLEDLSHLPHVEADPRRLHQILVHLMSNAIKYTPDGGEIFIAGRILPDAHLAKGGEARPGQSGEGQFVELTFRDTGIGIAPEDQERIFEKFYRVGKSALHSSGEVKFKGAGPGLGLPIARGLAEAHGGRLWAESPGHDEINCPGSTFHLILPVRAMPKPGITVTWAESLARDT